MGAITIFKMSHPRDVSTFVKYEESLDDENAFTFTVSDETTGYGTRIAGSRVRNKILNYLRRIDAPSKINIDFSGRRINLVFCIFQA